MKINNSFFYTLREDVKDEDSISSNLLVRAGFIKKNSSGVYMMLPMGWRVMRKIENIIREEMDATGCQELLMPALIPEDVYVASGRRAGFGKDMFSLKDRKGQPYVLGPTHEELFAIAAKQQIRSYKNMPFSLYQFETKFRDEPRPRYGLIRVREFIMKDAYTFDKDAAGMDAAYAKQFQAYKNIMDRLHLNYKIVRADTGVMGGLLSEEFQAVTPLGEDTLVLCESCDFASNIEVAPCVPDKPDHDEAPQELTLAETPNSRTIEEVAGFFHKDAKDFVKTLIYNIDGNPVAVMVRGDRDVNETKLRKFLNAQSVELADPDMVVNATGAQIGFAGPINIKCPVYADEEVTFMQNFIVGANKTGYHYTNVNNKDFAIAGHGDLRNIMEGDICPKCGGRIHFSHGIEVGNTFKLGTKYSKAMDLKYLDANNTLQYVWMGSYGIGPGRAMAALAEQNADSNGINWPADIAPYQVAIVIISMKDEKQVETANHIYDELTAKGVEVILDDRDERPGVKFKDMELIGIPYRITVGKGIAQGNVEWKTRTSDKQDIAIDQAVEHVLSVLKK
ncbi:MAG: proline--tRNA ligase [Solobacterium sp.]|jgi:prolyl-tRNA synthetase|nr:proline--tRNA ligase [Solobacterium sp.]MCH4205030.1 proline--tRNA ligase [Solobacterium sp.]MCH4226539.1 proline--tRNA ligase [Solobacterium sp.]MCH4281823.1 proline--tRNA ligase [Solobacterium sp.]